MNSREIARLAGRHFVIGFDGTELSPEVRRALQDWNLAGAIVFRRNIESPRQLLALARELQADAEGAVRILAIDQEGGRVARLSDPFTVYPPVRSLGNLGKEELARAYGLGGLPHLRIFDRRGRLRYQLVGQDARQAGEGACGHELETGAT